MKKIILALIFMFYFTIDSFAATYYISSGINRDGTSNGHTVGSDSNVGSLASPWLSLQKAADTAVAGDVVYVLGGRVYGGLFNTNSGTQTSKITFKNYNDETVYIWPRTSAGHPTVIIPAGTTWTNLGANASATATKWASPNGSVSGSNNGTGGILRNHRYWFANTIFSANYGGHGADPWYYSDTANARILLNQVTDPGLDEWVVVDSAARGISITGVDWLVFEGMTVEYSFDGFSTGSGNVAGEEADHILCKNMVFRYNGRRGAAPRSAPNAPTTDHRYENCTFERNGEHGFKLTDDQSATAGVFTNLEIIDSLAQFNGYHGFQVSNGGDGVTFINVISHDNGINPCGRIATSSEGCASFMGQFNNGVANNVSWTGIEAYATGAETYWGNDATIRRCGISVFSTSGLLIDRGRVHDNPGPGLYALSSTGSFTNNKVINTVFEHNGTWDVEIGSFQNIELYNDTLDGGASGGLTITSATGTRIFKNLAISSPTGVPLISIITGSSPTLDHNAYYSPDASPFSWAGVSYDFAGYKAASTQDANSINTDFRGDFVDYNAGNYSITTNSTLLKDAGEDLSASSVLTDHRLLPRPQGSAYSIGAYEEGSGLLIS